MGCDPTTGANNASGCMGFMNAAFGFRLDAAFFAGRRAAVFFVAGRLVAFLAAFFFFVAIGCRSSEVRLRLNRYCPMLRSIRDASAGGADAVQSTSHRAW